MSGRDWGPSEFSTAPNEWLWPEFLREAVAFSGGFGFGTLAMLSASWIGYYSIGIWIVAVVLASAMCRRVAALLGVVASLAGWLLLWQNTPAAPVVEGSGFDMTMIVFVGGCIIAAISYGIGIPFRVGQTPRQLELATAAAGLVAALMFGVAAVVFVAVPAGLSFDLTVPSGWTVVSQGTTYQHGPVQFGYDYTAVFGADRAPSLDAVTVPVIGVSVVGGPADVYAGDLSGSCVEPFSYGGLLGGTSDPVPANNPLPSSRELVFRNAAGAKAFDFTLARMRMVGVLPEHLCYLVAVTLPAETSISESDVLAIVSTFRFR